MILLEFLDCCPHYLQYPRMILDGVPGYGITGPIRSLSIGSTTALGLFVMEYLEARGPARGSHRQSDPLPASLEIDQVTK